MARRSFPAWLLVPVGAGSSLALQGIALAQKAPKASGAGRSGSSFDLWSELGKALKPFGPWGLMVLALLAGLGWLIANAKNIDVVRGWFRGQPDTPSPSTPADSSTSSSGQPTSTGDLAGNQNIVVGGTGNQLLSNVSAEGDVVLRDKV